MITADDLTFLRRAIGIATAAVTTGDDPYGSLLAGPHGEVLIEAHTPSGATTTSPPTPS